MDLHGILLTQTSFLQVYSDDKVPQTALTKSGLVNDEIAKIEENIMDVFNEDTAAVWSNNGWSGVFLPSTRIGHISRTVNTTWGGNFDFSLGGHDLIEWESDDIGVVASYSVVSSDKDTNGKIAYILSSGDSIPQNTAGTNYIKSVSDMVAELPRENESGHTDSSHVGDHTESLTYEDAIQHALWKDESYNEGTIVNYNDMGLYDEAGEYEKFYNSNIKNGYNAYFNEIHSTKTIVNRENGTYTVGPFTLTYPDDGRFAYIENMYVINQDGTKSTSDISIIKSSSGRKYPSSGEQFYVEFRASSLNYPTSVKVYAEFNYLNTTYSKYEKLAGTGDLYQNTAYLKYNLSREICEDADIGPYELGDDGKPKETKNDDGTTSKTLNNASSSGEGKKLGSGSGTDVPDDGDLTLNKKDGVWTQIKTENIKKTTKIDTKTKLPIYTWDTVLYTYKANYLYRLSLYSRAERIDTKRKYTAQKSVQFYENDASWNKREWKKTNTNTGDAGIIIDLTTQVAGRVWVDQTSGKESKSNGIYGAEDKAMPNVEVVLFEYGTNKVVKTTTTDANGKYLFDKLSALSQYYVRFKYNGQYYEPTYYTTPSNTITNWKNTSNGTDYIEDRTAMNARFGSIGSSTANYKGLAGYNKTYSKDDLLGYTLDSNGNKVKTNPAVIDEFGRLILNSSSNAEIQRKIQYVKDCTMYSWTRNLKNQIDPYPASNIIVINYDYDRYGNLINVTVQSSSGDAYSWSGVNKIINIAREDKSQYINQGYKVRQEVDIMLKEDVDTATIEINGKTQTYNYATREVSTQDPERWDISVRLSDGYYNTNYSREVYSSDYQYKVSNYGDANYYGKTKDDELKVYVTYKVYVRNGSMSIRTRIDEIVHYYDSDYEYVPDRSYIEITRGTNKGKYDVKADYKVNGNGTSRYAGIAGTTTNLSGYQTMYIRGLDGIYLDGGQSANIYLTFSVDKNKLNNENWIKLDENVETAAAIGVGKESISEINGYSTLYKQGTEIPNVGATNETTVAGIVDIDSNPGNLNPNDVPKDGKINYKNFEDDTDKAPNIRIILNRDINNTRIISGYAWEDERNQVNNTQGTATGNGLREEKETLINGITVQLVEVMNNGTEYVWREFGSDITGPSSIGKGSGTGLKDSETPIINVSGIIKNYSFEGDKQGKYAFTSFVPGNYIVRFKYGDTEKTVLTTSSEVTKLLGINGENTTSYNGQDYKTTIYQQGLGTYENKSTANVTNASKLNKGNIAYKYDIAKGDTTKIISDAKDLYDVRNNVNDYADDEMFNRLAEILASYKDVPSYNGIQYSKEELKAMLDEFIAKTNMTAETGNINIEIEYNRTKTPGNTVNNKTLYELNNLDLGIEERPKAQIEINKDVTNVKVTLANGTVLFDATQGVDNMLWISNPIYCSYEKNLMKPSKFGSADNISALRTFGLVQVTMDKELMHGATIKVTYNITAQNIGETDYKEEQFYYTGVVKDKNTVVTTIPNKLVDYIPNNMQYYDVDNRQTWSLTTADQLSADGWINNKLLNNAKQYNTIITTNKTSTPLVPTIFKQTVNNTRNDSVTVPLTLTQVITAENSSDDLDYINIVELVSTTNTIGRKMEYSVVGNQHPGQRPQELDADMAEVLVLPPFGTTLRNIVIAIITILGASIVICGIVFIKKKVLRK